MMLGLSPEEEEERRINRLEHSKFLLYQVQQELTLYTTNKDCVLQCEDGSYWTSLPNIASISALVRNTCQVQAANLKKSKRVLTRNLYRIWRLQ